MKVLVVVASRHGPHPAHGRGARRRRARGRRGGRPLRAADDAGDAHLARGRRRGPRQRRAHGRHRVVDARVLRAHLAPLWVAGALRGKLGAAFVSGGRRRARRRASWRCSRCSPVSPSTACCSCRCTTAWTASSRRGCHWGPLAWTNPRGGEAGPDRRRISARRAPTAATWRSAPRAGSRAPRASAAVAGGLPRGARRSRPRRAQGTRRRPRALRRRGARDGFAASAASRSSAR